MKSGVAGAAAIALGRQVYGEDNAQRRGDQKGRHEVLIVGIRSEQAQDTTSDGDGAHRTKNRETIPLSLRHEISTASFLLPLIGNYHNPVCVEPARI